MQKTKPEHDQQRNDRTSVYVSELENWQCEIPGLSNVNEIVSRVLSEADRGFILL